MVAMTQEEFNTNTFSVNTRLKHITLGGAKIIGIDFDEQLFHLLLDSDGDDPWVRCENVELIDS